MSGTDGHIGRPPPKLSALPASGRISLPIGIQFRRSAADMDGWIPLRRPAGGFDAAPLAHPR